MDHCLCLLLKGWCVMCDGEGRRCGRGGNGV